MCVHIDRRHACSRYQCIHIKGMHFLHMFVYIDIRHTFLLHVWKHTRNIIPSICVPIFFLVFVKTSREFNSLHLCAPRFLTYASWIPCIYSAQENQRVAVRKKKSPWWEALKDNVSCRSATFQGIYPEVHTICMYDCLIQSGVRSAGNGSQVSLNNRSLLDKNRSLLEKSPICVWVESWNIRSLLNKVSILVIVVSLNIMLLLEEGPILAWQCP